MNEVNILINDTLNAFYLQLYCVRHMVKDHSDNERSNDSLNTFISYIDIKSTLERDIAQW